MKKLLFVSLICVLFVAGCTNSNNSNNVGSESPKPSPTGESVTANPDVNTDENPQEILEEYTQAIATQNAEKLVVLYGGSYEGLKNFSPESDQDDKQKLFANFLKLLPKISLNEIVEMTEVSKDEYKFIITFKQEDGTSFPTRELDSTTDKFTYTVKRVNNELKVMETPPYQA
jgi:hypothetical protein